MYVPAGDCKEEVLNYFKKLNAVYPEGMPKIPDDKFFFAVK